MLPRRSLTPSTKKNNEQSCPTLFAVMTRCLRQKFETSFFTMSLDTHVCLGYSILLFLLASLMNCSLHRPRTHRKHKHARSQDALRGRPWNLFFLLTGTFRRWRQTTCQLNRSPFSYSRKLPALEQPVPPSTGKTHSWSLPPLLPSDRSLSTNNGKWLTPLDGLRVSHHSRQFSQQWSLLGTLRSRPSCFGPSEPCHWRQFQETRLLT